MAAPSFQDLYDAGLAEALARRPTIAFQEGDVSDMFLAGAAAIGDLLIGYTAERIRATYVDGAQGDDLTLLADDHWNIQRQEASKASGTLKFTRIGSSGTFTIPIGTKVATARDALGVEVRYLTTTAVSWADTETSYKYAQAEAEVAGVAGNVDDDLIVRILDTLTEDATVNNDDAFAGGGPEESDADLRERIRQFPSTLRRGTLAALEYGAKQVSGVARATADQEDSGIVTVYVSDIDGGSSGSTVAVDPDVADDSTMTHDVAIELLNWAAAGALVYVSGGELLEVDINVTLTLKAGANVAELTANVSAAIEATVKTLQIGDTLYMSKVQTAARNVDTSYIVEAAVTMRTGINAYAAVNIAPDTANQILRAGSISIG